MSDVMLRREVKIDVDFIPISHLIKNLSDILEEYGECFVESEAYEDYGDWYTSVYYSYQSPETEVEKAKRESIESDREAWKIRQYEQLKRELGK